METRQRIMLDEQGTATFERALVTPATSESGRAETRVIETKRVDARVLEADRGGLPILPLRCRAVRQRDDVTVFVVEEPPGLRSVQWITRDEEAVYTQQALRLVRDPRFQRDGESMDACRKRLHTQEVFRIALPYLVFLYEFRNSICAAVRCYYRREPIRSDGDELCIPNLPNQARHDHDLQRLCLPEHVRHLAEGPGSSYADVVERIMESFWGSSWNAHWSHEFATDAERIPDVASPWEWERASAVDETFPLRAPWRTAPHTLGDVVDVLLGTGGSHTRTFVLFRTRVQAADEWDDAPAGTHDRIPVSPSRMIAYAGGVLEVGGLLTLDPDTFAECHAGGTFPIAWFSRLVAGCRFAKLEGVEDPIRVTIGDAELAAGLAYADAGARDPIVLDGVHVEPGALLVVRDAPAWAWAFGHTAVVIVQSARRDRVTGEVRASIQGSHLQPIIGAGDHLAPGLMLFPCEERDAEGNLASGEATLPDGTTVRVGDAFYDYGHNQIRRFTIAALQPLTAEEDCRRCATFTGDIEGTWRIEADDGALPRGFTRAPATPITEVRVGKRAVRLGDRIAVREPREPGVPVPRETGAIVEFTPPIQTGTGRRCVFVRLAGSGRWVGLAVEGVLMRSVTVLPPVTIEQGGKLFRCGTEVFRAGPMFCAPRGLLCVVERFEPAGEGSYDAVLDDGQRIPFVLAGASPSDAWEEVIFATTIGEVTLERGAELRLTRKVPGHRKGATFTVHHIANDATASVAPRVITTCGRGFRLTHANARYFVWRASGGAWQPFPEDRHAYRAAPDVPLDTDLGVGTRVCYLGNDPGTRFARSGTDVAAREIPATVVSVLGDSGEQRLVRFDRYVAGLHDFKRRFDVPLYQNVLASYLNPLPGATTVADVGLERVFATSGAACVDLGRVVGVDRSGRRIHVGDRVRVVSGGAKDEWSELGDHPRVGTLFHRTYTVVWGRDTHTGIGLYAGSAIRHDTCHYCFWMHDFAPGYTRDPKWHKRLAQAHACYCVVVD